MRTLISLTTASILAFTLTACGSSDSDGDDAATGVLEGKENGLAKGSTTEVPYDPSVVASGLQEATDTPANIFAQGAEPETYEPQNIVAEFTILEVIEGSLEDYDFLDDEDLANLEGTTPYYVHYKAAYVNGPVTTQGLFTMSFGFADASGDNVSSGAWTFGGNGEQYPSQCDDVFQVESFGEGAYYEGCTASFLTSEPATISWGLGEGGEPVTGDPVTWPVD